MSEILFKTKFKVMRHCASKNEKTIRYNRKTNNPFIGKTDDAILAEKYMLNILTIEKLKNRIETIDCDVNLKAIFYIPKSVFWTKKKERNKKIIDLSNAYELIQDCLQKVKIINDDTQICSHNGSCRMPIDGTEYYLEIELTRFT